MFLGDKVDRVFWEIANEKETAREKEFFNVVLISLPILCGRYHSASTFSDLVLHLQSKGLNISYAYLGILHIFIHKKKSRSSRPKSKYS